jgi:mono/diheme cytochrome c family protein
MLCRDLVRYAAFVAAFGQLLSVHVAGEEPQRPPTFEQSVWPILVANCVACHGAERPKGGLDLRTVAAILRGGESGTAIVRHDSGDSLLIERIVAGEMPPGEKGKLTAKDVAVVRAWVEAGAPAERPDVVPPTPPLGSDRDQAFWAFRPLAHGQAPAPADSANTANEIDAFLLAKLAEKALRYSPRADRVTLVRRLSLDLLGLPPSPEEVDGYVADRAPDAYERLVDRLLASPHFGERWGRHWLDVAGYADSDGYTAEDLVRSYAYKYRDYVIRAFNDDKPFDQFIQEQLAGDEMVGQPLANLRPDQIEKLVATGYLKMAPDGTGVGSVDANVARNQVVADTIKIVSASLLGLTVGCAECHSHKYDPISHTD